MAQHHTRGASPTPTPIIRFPASWRWWFKRNLVDLYRRLSGTDFVPLGDPNQYFRKKKGHLYAIAGDTFHGRYTLLRNIGLGGFSSVWICWDNRSECLKALKICKGSKRDVANTRRERIMLEELRGQDPHSNYVVKYFGCFMAVERERVHRCMDFELLGLDLKCVIGLTERGMPVGRVKDLTIKLLRCVHFLHGIQIIHGDLKPQNIMFFDPTYYFKLLYDKEPKAITNADTLFSRYAFVLNERLKQTEDNIKRFLQMREEEDFGPKGGLRLGDFGNASRKVGWDPETRGGTLAYSSPELVCGIKKLYSEATDIWSAGCIIFEMATATLLFPEKGNMKRVFEAYRIFGNLTAEMQAIVEACGSYGQDLWKPSLYFRLRGEMEHVESRVEDGWTDEAIEDFSRFLEPMLSIDPDSRPRVYTCLDHSWLK